MTEKDIERLIAGSEFTNPDHKRRLREQLFGGAARELGLDELAAVAGGFAHPDNAPDGPENNESEWTEWPVSEEKPG